MDKAEHGQRTQTIAGVSLVKFSRTFRDAIEKLSGMESASTSRRAKAISTGLPVIPHADQAAAA